VLKPTHMTRRLRAAELRFNYYGTIGTNRDEFVVVRKMKRVDWLDHARRLGRHRSRRPRLKEIDP